MVGAWSSALCNQSSSGTQGVRDCVRSLASRCQLIPLTAIKLQQHASRAGVRANGTMPSTRMAYEVDTPAHPLAGVPAVTPAGSPSLSVDEANGQNGNGSTGLSKNDYSKFVQFFRQAGPYIEGHRDKTFVIVIPGSVSIWPCAFLALVCKS